MSRHDLGWWCLNHGLPAPLCVVCVCVQGCKEKTVVVANKAEGAILTDDMQQLVYDSYSLGMGEAVPISAGHNEGIADLLLAIYKVIVVV